MNTVWPQFLCPLSAKTCQWLSSSWLLAYGNKKGLCFHPFGRKQPHDDLDLSRGRTLEYAFLSTIKSFDSATTVTKNSVETTMGIRDFTDFIPEQGVKGVAEAIAKAVSLENVLAGSAKVRKGPTLIPRRHSVVITRTWQYVLGAPSKHCDEAQAFAQYSK